MNQRIGRQIMPCAPLAAVVDERDEQQCDEGENMRIKHAIAICAAVLLLAGGTALCPPVWAEDADESSLAQDLTNPVADLLTVPIQMNLRPQHRSRGRRRKLTTNIQPVIPFDLGGDWNLITRTIVPVVYQDELFPQAGSQFGLGDINTSLFFSPKQPTAGGHLGHRPGDSAAGPRPTR
jgi:hypothetical protein